MDGIFVFPGWLKVTIFVFFWKAQHLLIPVIIFARKVESWSGGETGDRESPGLPPAPSSASLSLISSYPAAD